MPTAHPQKNLQGRSETTRLADFFFEISSLKVTPRTGYQFLGSGQESVAEHSFSTALIGYALAKRTGANPTHTAMLCLIHDLHEARTGDFNYVNKLYNTCNTQKAMEHALTGTGLAPLLLPLWQELTENTSLEAQTAHDADQLDLIVQLKKEQDLQNPYAKKWLEGALPRLHLPQALELAKSICATDHTDWWFLGPDASWWQGKKE